MLKTRPKPTVEAEDRSQDAAREIGRTLREARQARGERLADVADYLRIKAAYLEALEAGEFDRIPGRPYVMGFVRSYGGYLGLDGEKLVGSLKSSVERVAAAPALNYREPIAESRRGTAVMLTMSMLLVATVYAGYYLIYHVDRGQVEPVAEAPGEVARLATETLRRGDAERAARVTPAAPERPAARAPQPGGAREPIQALVASEADPGPARAHASEPPASTPTSASAAPASASELLAALDGERSGATRPARPLAGDPEGRVSLIAHASSWIQVRSRGGDYVRTLTLAPGERFNVPNRDDLALSTGNAGGVELIVDGRSQGLLGRPGEVVRNRALAPDRLGAQAAR